MEIAKSVSPETNVINLLRIASSQQVMLKVRFLEVSRSTERDLGVNIFSANKAGTSGVITGQSATTSNVASGLPLLQTIGTLASGSTNVPFGTAIASLGGNVDLMITALETKGLVRQLAEPDLVALSGDTASFFAGGEIPIPVALPNSGSTTITVEYKPFGVQLTFQPTVLASGLINLRLTPTVSELDKTNSIEAGGYKNPGAEEERGSDNDRTRRWAKFRNCGPVAKRRLERCRAGSVARLRSRIGRAVPQLRLSAKRDATLS